MIPPRIPPDEEARLEVLRCYRILDTPPEREFDELARVAAHVADMPIALVTLVDAERQWFKARVGDVAEQTPREISFCAHAILTPREPLVVEDPFSDPRFAGNPDVVGGLGIRYYAGVPLVSSEGQAVGTLCVVDRRPNRLTPAQLEVLRSLGRQVVALLELRRTAHALDEARKRLADQEKALALHDLVMGVAHEVNNPLTFMRMASDLVALDLEELRRSEASPERAERFGRALAHQARIREGVARLARIGTTLHRITRRPSDSPAPELALDELVAAALAAHAPPGVPVEPALGSGARVRVHPSGMRETLAALLANAAESMQGRPGRIVVRTAREGTLARVEVEDQGTGVAEEDRTRLFTPFFTTKHDGLGCSLALARRVVEDHGGRIGFRSRPGEGSTFFVELPLAR